MKYVLLGKIVNTHGLKGEMRLISHFKYKNKVFKEGSKIYIGKLKQEEEITSYRPHKQFDMICLKDYSNINQILKYKGLNVYINSEDLVLNKNEYLDSDLIGLDALIDNKVIGKITKIEYYGPNQIIFVNNGEKDCLIPYNFDIIESINLSERKMYIKNIKGLIE